MSEPERGGEPGPLDSTLPLQDESASLLEEAQALARLGTWLSDRTTNKIIWSRALFDILGVREGLRPSRELYVSCIHPDDQARVTAFIDEKLASAAAATWEHEHRVVRPGGDVRWVHGRSRAYRDARGVPLRVVGVIQDVTDRKRAIEELRASEERARSVAALVEWSREAMIGLAADGSVSSWNSAAERLFGYAEAEIVGKPIITLVPDGLRAEVSRAHARVAAGEPVEMETVRRCKDGRKIEVSVSMSPIRDREGRVVGVCKIARDMSESRRGERALRRAEQQLREAQKMEAVGLLAGGIAHDFNNLLSAIVGYTELVLDTLPSSDPIRNDIIEVRKAGASAVSLTRQLLALSRRQVLQPRVIDLNQVVANLERMLRRLIGPNVKLTFDLANELGRVSADPSQIEQVIINLVLNARDAIVDRTARGMDTSGGEGTLTLSSANVWLDQMASEGLNVALGDYVMLAVSDTGVGMDEATIARIFEPFFTTKPKGQGTGLGLSTALGIVQQSGGAIGLDSRPGRGTTVRIYLPRTERPLQNAYSLPPSRSNQRGWETILLVEDDDQVRALARTALRRHGYQVLEAEHGEQALFLCEQHIGSIHLLLTDVVMPGMGGRELAERATALRPEMKVLFMSGYANDDVLVRGIQTDEVALLQKPITPNALIRRVRESLGTR